MDAVVNVFETLQKANLYLIDLKKKNDTASKTLNEPIGEAVYWQRDSTVV